MRKRFSKRLSDFCHLGMCDQWSAVSFMRFYSSLLPFLPRPQSKISQQLQTTVYTWPSAQSFLIGEKRAVQLWGRLLLTKTSSLNVDHPDGWQKGPLMGSSTVWRPHQLVKHINLFVLTQHNLYEGFSRLDEEPSTEPCPYSNEEKKDHIASSSPVSCLLNWVQKQYCSVI